MSFGFAVSDFITVIELANKIRKEFVGAPSQFKAISDEVKSLSIVFLDFEVVISDCELRDEQVAELKQIADGCGSVLDQLEHTLDEYDELKYGHGSVTKRVKRMWKRLNGSRKGCCGVFRIELGHCVCWKDRVRSRLKVFDVMA